ncbi:MAG: PilN domain-containing protein [Candidatus Aminicenantales bacterium]
MIRVNLLKADKKEVREKPVFAEKEYREKRQAPKGNLILIFFVIILAALAFNQKRTLDREKNLLSSAQEEKKKLQNLLTKLEKIESQKSFLEKKVNLITLLKAQQIISVQILNELNKNLPEWIWLTEVSYNRPKIQIKGRALSNNLIADFIYNLENSPFIDGVSLSGSTQKSIGGSQYLEFSMSAAHVLPPELQAQEKAADAKKKTEKK